VSDGRVLAPFGRRRGVVGVSRTVGAYTIIEVLDRDGPEPAPGQFYMLSTASGWGAGTDERPFLPRALSVMGQGNGRLWFMFEDVGPGTHRLDKLRKGEPLLLAGPFGNGFPAPQEGRRPILCGGGVGAPPLINLANALRDVTLLLGFRSARHAEVVATIPIAQVATDDGSVGHHGLVTDLLDAELDRDAHAEVFACGPPGMLEAIRARCVERGVPGQLALESAMACGFGACYGCVAPLRGGGYARVCVDGPVLAVDALAEVPAH
jgi:dihydroorotate dehydrogenase electron transfer subunit